MDGEGFGPNAKKELVWELTVELYSTMGLILPGAYFEHFAILDCLYNTKTGEN